MPLEPQAFAFIAQINEAYTRLMHAAEPEAHLGGKLFYAGELTDLARAATVAANIAGAATLTASAEQPSAKQAMRGGIVDFLVNSLDEALRILKNEIRKRETVAVCVTAAAEAIEREMQDRGVQPDITLSRLAGIDTGAEEKIWLTWRASQSPAQWLPKLDALASASLPPDAIQPRRWLERAPRYLGRLAQNARVLRTTTQHADQFLAAVRTQIAAGEIPASIQIEQGPWGDSVPCSLVPTSLRP